MPVETFKQEWKRWIKGPGYCILVIEGVEDLDPVNANVDIEVHFDDGRGYGGALFTPENLRWLIDKENSPYYCSPYMLVVRDLHPETIAETVAGLIQTNSMEELFVRYADKDNPQEYAWPPSGTT